MSRNTLLLAALLLIACGGSSPAPEPTTPERSDATPAEETSPEAHASAGIDIDDPATCTGCHAPIVSEWQESMHARAHVKNDPIFSAMRDLRAKKQGEQIVPKCRVCHNPRDTEDETSPAAMAGVSCATCHNLAGVESSEMAKGSKLLTYADDGVLRGPHDIDPGTSPAHGTGPAAPWLTDGQTVCLACHANTANPKGAPTCTTGSEIAASDDPDASCTSCHMPEVEGASGPFSDRPTHRSHQFLGPHRAWYQDDPSILAAAMDLELTWEDGILVATLTNQAGHAFPSGFPGRVAAVVVKGFDAGGAEVWTADAPGLLLRKIYVDAEGKPILPPFADSLKEDTRLQPGAVRRVTMNPPATVARAQATLVYRLLPPPAAEALGMTDAPEAQPKKVKQVEAKRD